MLEIKNIKVYDLQESVIASRNAMRLEMPEYTEEEFQESLKRAIKLANTPSGSGHQTFLSGIRVSFDIKYPNYISPELQRYHFFDIVTSSSKMHKLLNMDIDKACTKYVSQNTICQLKEDIFYYNKILNYDWQEGDEVIFRLRDEEEIHDKTKEDALYHAFMCCINDCPQGIELFMRCSTNYLQLKTIYQQRKHHKLREDWVEGFCKNFVEKLPYAKELIIGTRNE